MFDSELGFMGLLAALILIITGAVVSTGAAISTRMEFPMTQARIEQLRTDAAHVDPSQAEDVIGQVVEANKQIREAQTCNQLWYCDFSEPDGWNYIALIPVPKAR